MTKVRARLSRTKLRSFYKELLPKLASYQAENLLHKGIILAFGVANTREVEKLSINGQAVKDAMSHTDTKGQEGSSGSIQIYP